MGTRTYWTFTRSRRNSWITAGFTNTSFYAWEFLRSSGGFTGFDPANFTIDATSFANSLNPGDSFGVVQAGPNALAVRFTPVPEPAAVLLVAAGLGVLGRSRRRVSPRLAGG